MVCNPAPPKVQYVPDMHAIVTCPFCREKRVMTFFDLRQAHKPTDGTAEWVCNLCRGMTRYQPDR